MRVLVALTSFGLLAMPVAGQAEAVTCNLEEVSADQQMFCVPLVVYDEEGEIIGGAEAASS